MMDNEFQKRKFRAEDAKNLLANPLLREAFKAVGEYIEEQALSCRADDKDMAARIIISKQILAGIKREIERVVEDGKVAEMQIAEMEQRTGIRRFIR